MNRIDKVLQDGKKNNKKLLSPYITAGDPSPKYTLELMHALVEAGADILEIGIPFSDPMAEGKVIQDAMERALQQGMTCKKVLALIQQFRKTNNSTPIIIMGYVNPIENYGYASFAKDASEAGVDGTILVDMPPEESAAVRKIWDEHNLFAIYLCSPTTSAERINLINSYARGYLYYVSLKGVTGSSDFEMQAVKANYLQRKSSVTLPLLLGFGIKNATMAAEIANFADGVIVGAALIETIHHAYQNEKDCVQAGALFLKEIRIAINGKN